MPRKRGRKIRKSHEIVLGVAMLSLVATLTGCDDSAQPRRCVDGNGNVVSEDQCRDDAARRYYYGGPPVFFWYFGGGGGYAPGKFCQGRLFYSALRLRRGPVFGFSRGGASGGSGAFGGTVGRGGFGGSSGAHGGGGIGG